MSAVVNSPPLPIIRAMHPDDLTAVLAIEQAVYDFPWTQGIMHDCLRVGYSCWVFESDTTLIGYGIMSVAAQEAHILNLCIAPNFQNQGLGKKMLHHLLGLAVRYQARHCYLEVRGSNASALQLYKAAGFHEAGVRRDYYPATRGREDAIIMEKVLIS